MSLFIGTLAFNDSHLLNSIKIGVIIGSILSGLTGYIVLRFLLQILSNLGSTNNFIYNKEITIKIRILNV